MKLHTTMNGFVCSDRIWSENWKSLLTVIAGISVKWQHPLIICLYKLFHIQFNFFWNVNSIFLSLVNWKKFFLFLYSSVGQEIVLLKSLVRSGRKVWTTFIITYMAPCEVFRVSIKYVHYLLISMISIFGPTSLHKFLWYCEFTLSHVTSVWTV